MHGKQTRKYRVYGCAVITMAARARCGSWRFFAICNGMPWLLPHQNGQIAQSFSQGISTVLAPIAWPMLSISDVAALALFIGCYDARKLLDARTTLQSLAANGLRQFKLLMGEVLRRQSCAAKETGLGTEGNIAPILPKDERRTLVECKQYKRRQVGVSRA